MSVGAKKFAQHGPYTGTSAKKLAPQAQKRRMWGVLSSQGELFRAWVLKQSRRANFFVHRTRPLGDVETNDTSAGTDVGQHETAITTARP
ncbi:MAG: hypothetical protein KHZ63_09120 [Actinomyces sp.]|nr:hypothetical protein [Actinomyces sp.]